QPFPIGQSAALNGSVVLRLRSALQPCALGRRLKAGRGTLNPAMMVRIHPPQLRIFRRRVKGVCKIHGSGKEAVYAGDWNPGPTGRHRLVFLGGSRGVSRTPGAGRERRGGGTGRCRRGGGTGLVPEASPVPLREVQA